MIYEYYSFCLFLGTILTRFSEWSNSKLTLFTFGRKNRPDLRFGPQSKQPKFSKFDSENLFRFLRAHQETLETFFWEPFPQEIAADAVELILRLAVMLNMLIFSPRVSEGLVLSIT